MRRILTRPPRPLPDWWPEGQPWPPVVSPASRPMPAWWPENEPWPPRSLSAEADAPVSEGQFPVRVAVLLAIGLNLVAAGALAGARVVTSTLPWPVAWPLTALLLVAGTAWLFVLAMERIGAPLSAIVAAARRVGTGDFSVRIEERGFPWLRSVAAAFNVMTTRLARQQRERRALMADIAHELRTPVAVLQGRIEGMLDGVYAADERQVRRLLDDTRMLARLVEDLRTSAHAESGTLTLRREGTDLGVLVEEVADMLAHEAATRKVRIATALPPALPNLAIDPQRIREVLINLASNALRHAPPGGAIEIACESGSAGIVVRVMDRGPGIPPHDLSRVFERFHKDPSSTGSGLGLTIAKSLVIAHGGTIEATNRDGGGTTMVVTLPASCIVS